MTRMRILGCNVDCDEVCLCLYYFYKSTHIGKKKLWQHWNAPCHANGAYRKEKGGLL